MIGTPDFNRRRQREIPISFVPVERVFQPQVRVRSLVDLSGWASRDRRVKWSISAGRIGCLDADKAREFQTKGYVELLDGEVKPVSEDEAAEFLSTVTTITV